MGFGSSLNPHYRFQLCVVDGEILVSEATVQFMKAWLEQIGISIQHEYELSPSVAVHVPIDLDVIGVVRDDPRIDYFEPDLPGSWARGPSTPFPNLLVGIVNLASLEPSPSPGTSVVAKYQQPGGSILTAEMVVR